MKRRISFEWKDDHGLVHGRGPASGMRSRLSGLFFADLFTASARENNNCILRLLRNLL